MENLEDGTMSASCFMIRSKNTLGPIYLTRYKQIYSLFVYMSFDTRNLVHENPINFGGKHSAPTHAHDECVNLHMKTN